MGTGKTAREAGERSVHDTCKVCFGLMIIIKSACPPTAFLINPVCRMAFKTKDQIEGIIVKVLLITIPLVQIILIAIKMNKPISKTFFMNGLLTAACLK